MYTIGHLLKKNTGLLGISLIEMSWLVLLETGTHHVYRPLSGSCNTQTPTWK